MVLIVFNISIGQQEHSQKFFWGGGEGAVSRTILAFSPSTSFFIQNLFKGNVRHKSYLLKGGAAALRLPSFPSDYVPVWQPHELMKNLICSLSVFPRILFHQFTGLSCFKHTGIRILIGLSAWALAVQSNLCSTFI